MMKKLLHLLVFLTIFTTIAAMPNAVAAQGVIYGCGGNIQFTESIPDDATCNCNGASWQPYTTLRVGVNITRGICCGWVTTGDWRDTCHETNPAETTAHCGDTYSSNNAEMQCICHGGDAVDMGNGQTCCGFMRDGACNSSDSGLNDVEVTGEVLDALNPLTIASGSSDLSTPGGVISRALTGFIFPIAGLILFIQLLLGGFQMLTGAANSKSIDEGKGKITAAIIGFIILFAAYWIAQLLELIFGIRILS